MAAASAGLPVEMSEPIRREAKYGKAIWDASRADEGTISYTGAHHVARAVMAVADAEINQVQDEAEGWAKSSGEAFSAWHEALARAEKAEAKLARVEALRAHIADPKNRASSRSSKRGQIVADVLADVLGEIDTALRGDSLHGPDCVDCRNGITEFHRSRTDEPNRLREDGRE